MRPGELLGKEARLGGAWEGRSQAARRRAPNQEGAWSGRELGGRGTARTGQGRGLS